MREYPEYYFIGPPGQIYIIAEDPCVEELRREHPDFPLITQAQRDLLAEKQKLSKEEWETFAREFTKKAIESL